MKSYPKIEWLRTGMLLAFAGGAMNAYTYIWRGGVLATMVTGNLVLMTLNSSWTEWQMASRYLFPILSFAFGVFAAECIKHKAEQAKKELPWRKGILALEIMIILAVTQLPIGAGDLVTNIAIAFVSAVQVESFRNIRGYPAFTTMCSGNLRSGMEGVAHWLMKGEAEGRARATVYALTITGFLLGVLVCSLACAFLAHYVVLLAIIPLVIVFFFI